MSNHSRRKRATECKDCGSPEVTWWVGRIKHPGAAGCRCHPCYLRYTRRRQTPHGSDLGGRIYGPPKVKTSAALIPCSDCGVMFKRSNIYTRCTSCATARRRASEQRRRDVIRDGDKNINWRTLGPRDSWCCHICGRKVRQVPGTAAEPFGATVDHLLPITDGGRHVWANVKIAHRVCNLARSTGGTVQLLLVG